MAVIDFSRRSDEEEWMDVEQVSYEDFRDCLRDLAKVNHITLAHRPTLSFLERIVARRGKSRAPLEILDVGSGYGDMLRAIDAWAEARGVPVRLTGIDLNPWSRRAATEATRSGRPIRWVTADAFSFEPEREVDMVVSSLFTHHLDDAQIVRFLRHMQEVARIGWFVNDLERHPVAYHLFRHAADWLRYHRFVRHDGPVSIQRAFVAHEWSELLERADIPAHSTCIRREMPFRLTVEGRA